MKATSDPRKPPINAPCNGCGMCCTAEPCPMAVDFLGAPMDQACPALEWEGGRAWCGLIRHPAKHMESVIGPVHPLLARAISETAVQLSLTVDVIRGRAISPSGFKFPTTS